MRAKFKCVGSLGWDISVSYHVLQLLSSLTSRSNAAVPETGRSQLLNLLYQAIILRTTFNDYSAKKGPRNEKKADEFQSNSNVLGLRPLGWGVSGSYHVLQPLSSLTSRSTALPETEKSVIEHIVSCDY